MVYMRRNTYAPYSNILEYIYISCFVNWQEILNKSMALNVLERLIKCDLWNRFVTFHLMCLCFLLMCDLSRVMAIAGDGRNDAENNTNVVKDIKQRWKLNDIPAAQLELFQEIVHVMEKLHLFDTNESHSACFSLGEIVKDVSFPAKSSKKIGIHFYFEESIMDSDSSVSVSHDTAINFDHISYANTIIPKAGNCNISPSYSDIHGIPGLDRLSRKQDDKNQRVANGSSSKNNVTAVSGVQDTKDTTGSQHDRQRGLSRTQVVVIATCAAVIGTFFIIAGALRIHSCVKRYRANREAALVIARRTSTFAFNSTGNLRRDSSTSKASRQQSYPAPKPASDTQVDINGTASNSHNSPQHSSDHKPLLPVHIASHLSDGSDSHGSLAFIDEETYNKRKSDNNSGSDLASEDDPLLRKSPDSGSSADVVLEDDYDVKIKDEQKMSPASSDTQTERNSSSPPPRLTSPSREIVFEPGGETDSENGVCKQVNSQINENTCQESNENNPINDPPVEIANEQTESVSNTLNEKENDCKLTVDSGDTYKIENENLVVDNSGNNVNSSGRKRYLPRKQFSVDYFDVDENGIEIQNPIFEESDAEELINILSEDQAVTTGLTQSDGSISNNPSYCYGNQTEYDLCNGYGQTGYCCPYTDRENAIKHTDVDGINYSLRNTAFLSSEMLRRENGELINDSFDDTDLSVYSRNDSLNNDPKNPKISRMFSSDSYFCSTAPVERTNSVTTYGGDGSGSRNTNSTLCTKKLRIVPLSEYHRNSLKETIDEDDVV